EFAGQVGETGLNIEQFALDSPVMKVSATGKIANEGGLTYDIGLQGRVSLADTTRILAPETKVQGAAIVDGKIEGTQSAFKINGNVRSDEIVAMGARMRGGRNEEINIMSNGGPVTCRARYD